MDVGSSPIDFKTGLSNGISQIDAGFFNVLIESHKAGDIPLEELKLIALSHFNSQNDLKVIE